MSTLPETILQFGSGRFLRAFADLVHPPGQPARPGRRPRRHRPVHRRRPGRRAEPPGRPLSRRHSRHRERRRSSIASSRARASAGPGRRRTQWDDVLDAGALAAVARHPVQHDREGLRPRPRRPARRRAAAVVPGEAAGRAARALRGRASRRRPSFRASCASARPTCCSARRRPGARLEPAREDFSRWLEMTCVWLNTLVDRIVTGTPAEHPLLAQDPMLTACEPYALFAIEEKPRA